MSLAAPDTSRFGDTPIVRVWRHRNFALFMMGTGPFYVTGWMQRIAVGWLGWELSHSHAWVGAIAAADLAPMIVLGPLAGAVADRSDPVRLLQRAQAIMIAQAVAVTTLVWLDAMTIGWLLALSFVSGCTGPVYTAARQTIVPTLVPREDLASAVSIDASLYHASRFIGPALAAFAMPQIGIASTSAAHILGCAYFYALVRRSAIAMPERTGKVHGSILVEIADGIGYVRRHAGFWPLFMMLGVASLLARPLQELLPGFAGDVFQQGANGLAWLTSSMGVGSLSAAIFLASRGRGSGLATLSIVALCGLSLATFGFVATRHLGYAAAFGVTFGFTLTLMGVAVQALVQIGVADNMRGRVMSLYALVFRGLPALGALAIGALAEHIGLRSTFALAALVCLAAWVVVAGRAEAIERAVGGRE